MSKSVLLLKVHRISLLPSMKQASKRAVLSTAAYISVVTTLDGASISSFHLVDWFALVAAVVAEEVVRAELQRRVVAQDRLILLVNLGEACGGVRRVNKGKLWCVPSPNCL